jgi:hypothetical protein
MALIAATFLIPLWKQIIPDWLRGGLFILLGLAPLPALSAFFKLMPALEKLYNHPLKPGPGVYWIISGMALMVASGVLMIFVARSQRSS